MKNPKVSVIVPVYRVEKYLHRCVDSILQQTYSNLEVILVDDGSPDRCGIICDDYADKDSRILVIHQENLGLAMARNKGLNVSTGEFILFVDSDDYIHHKMIETMVNNLLETSSDVCICGRHRFSSETSVDEDQLFQNFQEEKKFFTKKHALVHLFTDMSLIRHAAWDKIYKKSIYENIFFPEGKYYEDGATTFRLLSKCEKISYISDPFYYYAINPNSITEQKYTEKHAIDHMNVLSSAIQYFQNTEFETAAIIWNIFELMDIWKRCKTAHLDHVAKDVWKRYRCIFYIKAMKDCRKVRHIVRASIFYINPQLESFSRKIYQTLTRNTK